MLHHLRISYPIPTPRSLPQPKSPLISAVASSRAAPEYSTSTPHMQKKTLRPEEVKRLARIRATIKNGEAGMGDVSSTRMQCSYPQIMTILTTSFL